MKKTLFQIWLIILTSSVIAQSTTTLQLNPPDTDRGLPVMEALTLRASASDWDSTKLDLQDLSDLLWAANGINRPESGKRTAPSALNAQDIDIYVCMKSGIYLYDAKNHLLEMVVTNDHRSAVAGRQQEVTIAPVHCILVSDISRFRVEEDSVKLFLAAADAGIVSQNISIFCASVGLATRPRAAMDQQKLREILMLTDSQHLLLNHPVSYK